MTYSCQALSVVIKFVCSVKAVAQCSPLHALTGGSCLDACTKPYCVQGLQPGLAWSQVVEMCVVLYVQDCALSCFALIHSMALGLGSVACAVNVIAKTAADLGHHSFPRRVLNQGCGSPVAAVLMALLAWQQRLSE